MNICLQNYRLYNKTLQPFGKIQKRYYRHLPINSEHESVKPLKAIKPINTISSDAAPNLFKMVEIWFSIFIKKTPINKYPLSLAEIERVILDGSLSRQMWNLSCQFTKNDQFHPVVNEAILGECERYGFNCTKVQLPNQQLLMLMSVPRISKKGDAEDYSDETTYWKMVVKNTIPLSMTFCSLKQWSSMIAFWSEERIEKVQLPSGWKISLIDFKVPYSGGSNIYSPRIVQRTYKILHESGEHITTHLHYENWPDHCEAPDIEALEELFRKRYEIVTNFNQPIIIMCRGGVGRTGIGALIECSIREIEIQLKRGVPLGNVKVDVFNLLYQLRKARPMLVSEEEQLIQVYQVIFRFYKSLQSLHGHEVFNV